MNQRSQSVEEQEREQTATFSGDELARLRVYLAAVAAGFYSDDCAVLWDDNDDEALKALLEAELSEYPFTPEETDRLAACKQAVSEGLLDEYGLITE